jgi:hypothetical protein
LLHHASFSPYLQQGLFTRHGLRRWAPEFHCLALTDYWSGTCESEEWLPKGKRHHPCIDAMAYARLDVERNLGAQGLQLARRLATSFN